MTDDRRSRALVATPANRDRAIARLQDHLARNHIELDRFEELVERAERATTDAQLERLFDGLPVIADVVPIVPAARVRATLAAVTRRGHFAATNRIEVRAIFGSVELDLTEAELARGETVVDVTAWFGSVTITVLEGVAVDCAGDALLGSFDHVALPSSTKRDARRIKITGRARFGSVDIVVKKRPAPVGALQQIGDGIRALLGK